MYIAGSHTARDFYDDVTKIPVWGSVKDSERYQQAEKMLKANPQIRTLVAHSLGGSVAHELQREHPGLKTVTYGSPAISWGKAGGEGRFRNAYDPISIFDRGATQLQHPNPLKYGALTHDYHNSSTTSAQSSLDVGVENPDGSVSISE